MNLKRWYQNSVLAFFLTFSVVVPASSMLAIMSCHWLFDGSRAWSLMVSAGGLAGAFGGCWLCLWFRGEG